MPVYLPGQEPEPIQKRLRALFEKLDTAYPDKQISRLYQEHKKWGETVSKLYHELQYENATEFLRSYGYTLHTSAGGRPSEAAAVIEELRRRYPNGSGFGSVKELEIANPDLASKFKNLKNQASALFGMTYGKYLVSIGILAEKEKKPKPPARSQLEPASNLKKETPEISVSTRHYPEIPVSQMALDLTQWHPADGSDALLPDLDRFQILAQAPAGTDLSAFSISPHLHYPLLKKSWFGTLITYLLASVGSAAALRRQALSELWLLHQVFGRTLFSVFSEKLIECGYLRFAACLEQSGLLSDRKLLPADGSPNQAFEAYFWRVVQGFIPFLRFNGLFPEPLSVILPHGVTEIPDGAFRALHMISISLPETLVRIGDNAFTGNPLQEIHLPESVTKIGKKAFQDCWIQRIHLPGQLDYLGDGAFRNCKRLQFILLPESLEEIHRETFQGCTALKLVHSKGRLKKIGIGAFRDAICLQTITLPETLTDIGFCAFENCEALADPDGFIQINGILFGGKACHTAEVHIPSTVRRISDFAFQETDRSKTYCYSVIIPDGVQEIGGNAFSGCKFLSSVSIPDSVTQIKPYAFFNCKALQSIRLPKRLSVLSYGLFRGCTQLRKVQLPDTLEMIHPLAFEGCVSLHELALPPSVKEIFEHAFWNCTSLQALSGIPATVAQNAFENCPIQETFTAFTQEGHK